MKKIIACTVLFAALFSAAVFGGEKGITVNIDGEELVCDVEPQITEGRTMVPVRVIFEALGAKVFWNDNTKTASAVKDDTMVNMTVGSNILKKNGEKLVMDSVPVIEEGRILVPARYAAEAFGCTAEWDSGTKTVSITDPSAVTEGESGAFTAAPSCTPDMTDLKHYAFDIQPVDYSAMDEKSAEIHEEVRRSFEHNYFYDMLAAESAEVLAEYTDYKNYRGSYTRNAWNNNLNSCIAAYALENEENKTQIGSFQGDVNSEDFVSYITNDCQLSWYMNFNTTPRYLSDCIAFYVEMAEDRYISSCRYIVVLFDWDRNFIYYTLEKAADGYWNVCETTEKGSRILTSFSEDGGTAALRYAFIGAVAADYYADDTEE
ncbi:MAG: copper amine oxidase N-terminal domain-containing protein [Clostridiales bacterium]|nr:copper amine oxidase N-terminal domain-containing protein [Clostridiales bacterium]